MRAIAFSYPRNSSEEFATGNRFYVASDRASDASGEGSAPRLTSRQLEVLALLCEGLPNKLICRRLSIAAGTVKAHISSILRELGVASRLQAVVEARRQGLLDQQAEASVPANGSPVRQVDFTKRVAGRYGDRPSGE
jgi:DNA-binding CsgD family transcriptional regulator